MLLSKDSNVLLLRLNQEKWELDLQLVGTNPTAYFLNLIVDFFIHKC